MALLDSSQKEWKKKSILYRIGRPSSVYQPQYPMKIGLGEEFKEFFLKNKPWKYTRRKFWGVMLE